VLKKRPPQIIKIKRKPKPKVEEPKKVEPYKQATEPKKLETSKVDVFEDILEIQDIAEEISIS